MKPCPVCPGGRLHHQDGIMVGCTVCHTMAYAAAWEALPRVSPDAERLVDAFERAVKAKSMADWATAYGNSEPDRNAPQRVADARAALLKACVVDRCGAGEEAMTRDDPLVRRLTILRDTARQSDGKLAWVPLSELDALITALTAQPKVHVAELVDAAKQCGLYGHDEYVEMLRMLGVEVLP